MKARELEAIDREQAGPAAQGARISIEGLHHGFEREGSVVRALWGVDVEIEPGQFVSLVGPSGCGKTTLLAMIGGLIVPRSGTIKIDGAEVEGPPKQAAYMLARDALLPWRTAQHNVEYGLQIRGVPREERRSRGIEWLGRVGLADFADARVGELSQGMRQRVALARTLALAPQILLMDEPFAALDAQTRVLQQQEFLGLWERTQSTVVFVTHDLREAILLSDRVIIMSHRPGRVIADIRIPIGRPREAELSDSNAECISIYQELYERLREEVKAQIFGQEAVK